MLEAAAALLASRMVFVVLRDDDSVWLAYEQYFGLGESMPWVGMPRVGMPAAGIVFWRAGAVTGRATSDCIELACSLKNWVMGP